MWSGIPSHSEIVARSTADPLLSNAAHDYLTRGWSLIPLFGKLPAIPWKEFQTQFPTSAEIEHWFVESTPQPSGLGIVTGKLAALVVVDCDTPVDAAFWREHYPSSPLMSQRWV